MTSTGKTYHTIEYAEWKKHLNLYHPTKSSHGIMLPDGVRGFVVTQFLDEEQEMIWHEATKTRRSLPHPVFQGNEAIHADHAQELHHFFVDLVTAGERLKAAYVATVHDVVRRVARVNPLMGLSTFAYRSYQGKTQ